MLKNKGVKDVDVTIDLYTDVYDGYKYRVVSSPDFPGFVNIQYLEWDDNIKNYKVINELSSISLDLLQSINLAGSKIIELQGE